MRYHLVEEEPPRVPSTETDMRTVAYRTWQGWDNVAIGNRGKPVPDTLYVDFTSPNVYTSWGALDRFYEELEQVTFPYSEYTGFNGKGSELICRFFAEHDRYKCHIELKEGGRMLVKDPQKGGTQGGEHIMENDMKILRALIRRYGAVKVKAALIEAKRKEMVSA